jgi:hypothetical protein
MIRLCYARLGCYNFYSKIFMDILRMIAELQSERAAIEDALAVLGRLAQTRGKRRGRPPSWMSVIRNAESQGVTPRKTRSLSPETRKRMAEAQKKRWASYHKANA